MLRFIDKNSRRGSRYGKISIHLMLRFIKISAGSRCTITIFQYISCYGLSHGDFPCQFSMSYFNTSHVTVYLKLSLSRSLTGCYFNTSHVTVYRSLMRLVRNGKNISIHLMLRFIITTNLHHTFTGYISIHLMLRFIFIN